MVAYEEATAGNEQGGTGQTVERPQENDTAAR